MYFRTVSTVMSEHIEFRINQLMLSRNKEVSEQRGNVNESGLEINDLIELETI
jgi:hypothetical protein